MFASSKYTGMRGQNVKFNCKFNIIIITLELMKMYMDTEGCY